MSTQYLDEVNKDWRGDTKALRDMLEVFKISWIESMPDHALANLYICFCNIQCANWLCICEADVARFADWLLIGTDESAWS